MKQIRTILALLLCVCMLPLSAFAYTVDQTSVGAANVYTPEESGLYAVKLTYLDGQHAAIPADLLYEVGNPVSVTAGGKTVQPVNFNVFYLTAGTAYTLQVQKRAEGEELSEQFSLSVEKVDPMTLELNAEAYRVQEWFTFVPEQDDEITFSSAEQPVFVELFAPGAQNGDWAGYAQDKEAYHVAARAVADGAFQISMGEYSLESAKAQLEATKQELANAEEKLDNYHDVYEKAYAKLDAYKTLMELADSNGLIGAVGNNTARQILYNTILKPAARARGVEIPDDFRDFPDFAKEQIEKLEADTADYEAGQAWVEETREKVAVAEVQVQEGEQQLARAKEEQAANLEAVRVLHEKVSSDADAILNSASAFAAEDTASLALQSAGWLNNAEDTLKANVKSGTTYFVHVLAGDPVGFAGNSDGQRPEVSLDKTRLETAVADAEELMKQYPDSEYLAAMQDALAAAKDVLNNSEDQTTIDRAAETLSKAVAMVRDNQPDPSEEPNDDPQQGVDKTALQAAIDRARALDRSLYTTESYAAVTIALASASIVNISPLATQERVDEVTKALNDAIDALVLKDDDPGETVDKSKLEELIAAAEQFKPEDYTDASFGPLQDALDNAKAVLENKDASQEDVTNAVKSLTDAIAGLKQKPVEIDKSKLEEAISNAQQYKPGDYTDASFDALRDALENAKAVLENKDASQEDVTNAITAITNAIAGLKQNPSEEEPSTEVNKTNLQQLVDMIDKMDRSRFTDESLAALDQAQAEAKRVLADENATQADVDNAIRGLTEAQNGLKLKPATDANREALQKLVDQAEAIDRSKYTDDSLKALDNQIANAKAALDNPSASQTLITLAARRLTAAMNNLQEKDAAEPIHFVDVPDSAYYADAVDWAVRNGVTDGTDATHFSPKADCTRAQIVTFLWRALNKPEPKSNYNPFVDVQPGAYYYEAVLWAIGEGITDGTDATHFSPKDSCTRAHAVTFLWRMENKPGSSITNTGFVDVPAGAYYADAVRWAVANEITNGTDATHFSPKVTCSRAQIVTFLYRDRG